MVDADLTFATLVQQKVLHPRRRFSVAPHHDEESTTSLESTNPERTKPQRIAFKGIDELILALRAVVDTSFPTNVESLSEKYLGSTSGGLGTSGGLVLNDSMQIRWEPLFATDQEFRKEEPEGGVVSFGTERATGVVAFEVTKNTPSSAIEDEVRSPKDVAVDGKSSARLARELYEQHTKQEEILSKALNEEREKLGTTATTPYKADLEQHVERLVRERLEQENDRRRQQDGGKGASEGEALNDDDVARVKNLYRQGFRAVFGDSDAVPGKDEDAPKDVPSDANSSSDGILGEDFASIPSDEEFAELMSAITPGGVKTVKTESSSTKSGDDSTLAAAPSKELSTAAKADRLRSLLTRFISEPVQEKLAANVEVARGHIWQESFIMRQHYADNLNAIRQLVGFLAPMEDESNLNAIRQLVAPMEDGRHLVGFLAPMEDESMVCEATGRILGSNGGRE